MTMTNLQNTSKVLKSSLEGELSTPRQLEQEVSSYVLNITYGSAKEGSLNGIFVAISGVITAGLMMCAIAF